MLALCSMPMLMPPNYSKIMPEYLVKAQLNYLRRMSGNREDGEPSPVASEEQYDTENVSCDN